MNQNLLNRLVARATGESATFIRRRGFSLLEVPARPAESRHENSQEYAEPVRSTAGRFSEASHDGS